MSQPRTEPAYQRGGLRLSAGGAPALLRLPVACDRARDVDPRGPASADDSGVGALTRRELEIAGLVTDRKTNREIASVLFLSEKTIESHLRNIFVKLGSSTRVDARTEPAESPGSWLARMRSATRDAPRRPRPR